MTWTEKAVFLAFFVALALHFFVGKTAGVRGFGVWFVLFALALHKRGHIDFWISGQPGGWKLTGPFATVLNVLVAVIGLAVLIWPEVAIEISGGGAK